MRCVGAASLLIQTRNLKFRQHLRVRRYIDIGWLHVFVDCSKHQLLILAQQAAHAAFRNFTQRRFQFRGLFGAEALVKMGVSAKPAPGEATAHKPG